MDDSKIIQAIEKRIQELQKDEWLAKEAKDYVACIQFQGAIIQFRKILKEQEKKDYNMKGGDASWE